MIEIEKILKDLALDKESENQLRLKLEIFSEEQKLNTKKLTSKCIDYFMVMDSLFLLGSEDKNLQSSLDAVNQTKNELISLINQLK